jgi:hypothetical protein
MGGSDTILLFGCVLTTPHFDADPDLPFDQHLQSYFEHNRINDPAAKLRKLIPEIRYEENFDSSNYDSESSDSSNSDNDSDSANYQSEKKRKVECPVQLTKIGYNGCKSALYIWKKENPDEMLAEDFVELQSKILKDTAAMELWAKCMKALGLEGQLPKFVMSNYTS